MFPTLFSFDVPGIGPVEFPAYMTLLMVGFTLAIWMARREEDRSGREGDRVVDLGLLMLVCGLIGARLLSVFADGHFMEFVHLCTDPTLVPAPEAWARELTCSSDAQCAPYLCDEASRACHPARDCLEAFKFWHGGLAFYGGFLLAVPVGLWFARRKRLGVMRIADLVSPFIALGLFFGRMGCFFNGCCYGGACDLPWAVTFPGGTRAVHPTQLYEAAACLALAAVLYFVVRPKKRAHGAVFAGLLVGYGVVRFLLEYLRDDDRGIWAGLSTSQWIGIPVIAAGIWLFRKTWSPPAA